MGDYDNAIKYPVGLALIININQIIDLLLLIMHMKILKVMHIMLLVEALLLEIIRN